ncbi:uncharacterized protein Dmoj_GI26601 [Drosophila mojavensis]|uniref:Uncharacterized protein n=2 Tax=Drosophila mojavensis TaxID=7230 RepID=A0A0Q9X7B4_DROMO|nr:uncharacterized protein Dmoj_GI26601 [Drosophila mojavensis]
MLIVAITFMRRCFDDCNDNTKGPYHEDCYSAYALYTLYLPSVVASPLIMLTDKSSINYLQWWLLVHAALTCCAYFNYICYSPFYSDSDSDINIVGFACLVFAFGTVAFHCFRVLRSPAPQAQSDPAETAA